MTLTPPRPATLKYQAAAAAAVAWVHGGGGVSSPGAC